jgi:hypothetical protein
MAGSEASKETQLVTVNQLASVQVTVKRPVLYLHHVTYLRHLKADSLSDTTC